MTLSEERALKYLNAMLPHYYFQKTGGGGLFDFLGLPRDGVGRAMFIDSKMGSDPVKESQVIFAGSGIIDVADLYILYMDDLESPIYLYTLTQWKNLPDVDWGASSTSAAPTRRGRGSARFEIMRQVIGDRKMEEEAFRTELGVIFYAEPWGYDRNELSNLLSTARRCCWVDVDSGGVYSMPRNYDECGKLRKKGIS